ncbi:hypothetical protein DFH06DRAFT_1442087 [Mycena polygramma]|nr:hypothetical protein DFH06DRAFT_1442087 [Mycena polygramma]
MVCDFLASVNLACLAIHSHADPNFFPISVLTRCPASRHRIRIAIPRRRAEDNIIVYSIVDLWDNGMGGGDISLERDSTATWAALRISNTLVACLWDDGSAKLPHNFDGTHYLRKGSYRNRLEEDHNINVSGGHNDIVCGGESLRLCRWATRGRPLELMRKGDGADTRWRDRGATPGDEDPERVVEPEKEGRRERKGANPTLPHTGKRNTKRNRPEERGKRRGSYRNRLEEDHNINVSGGHNDIVCGGESLRLCRWATRGRPLELMRKGDGADTRWRDRGATPGDEDPERVVEPEKEGRRERKGANPTLPIQSESSQKSWVAPAAQDGSPRKGAGATDAWKARCREEE